VTNRLRYNRPIVASACISPSGLRSFTMRSACLYALLVMMLACPVRAQDSAAAASGSVDFLPDRNGSAPLLAHPHEARTGIHKTLGSPDLKLEVGTTFDVLEVQSPPGSIRLGVDFFAFARTTSAEGFRLQVDELDGFFGAHATIGVGARPTPFGARLRFLHRSGHLVDGHWDHIRQLWFGGQLPIPLTLDRWEAAGWYRWTWGISEFRVYTGVAYATLVRPGTLKRFGSYHGLEWRSAPWSSGIAGHPFWLYAAADISVDGIPAYNGSPHAVAGVRFGRWEERGVQLELTYDGGLDIYSQYYDRRVRVWRVGVLIDAW
jgi:hypothetical protein